MQIISLPYFIVHLCKNNSVKKRDICINTILRQQIVFRNFFLLEIILVGFISEKSMGAFTYVLRKEYVFLLVQYIIKLWLDIIILGIDVSSIYLIFFQQFLSERLIYI